MEQKIETLITDLFNINRDDITDSLSMADTDAWDSLKHMELIVSIEKAFDIELTFDEIVAMQTVEDIKKTLQAKGVE